jgi:short-subunit dehydrogenase
MSLPAYVFAGRTAVLTGAASGIGEKLAYDLAGRGSDLVLVDVDEARLKPVADRIRSVRPRLTVETIIADLASADEVARVAEQVPSPIGLLINNAGIALGGLFEHLTVAEFESVMDINFRAPLLLTHELLPVLLATPGSHLVNISSLFGLITPPGQSAYCASKFALRGFSEVLRAELDGRVGVTTVHPGGIRTKIARNAKVGANVPAGLIDPQRKSVDALLTYPPEKAAAQILDAVAKRKGRLLIALSAKGPDLLARLLPGAYVGMMVRAVNRGQRNRS